ncbi:MAG: arginine--tRNA ligase [bacterium]|nr:arginine--tRNA ligase [bacterium]
MDIVEKLKGIIDKNLPDGWDASVDLSIRPEFGDYSAIINSTDSESVKNRFNVLNKIKEDIAKEKFYKENIKEIKVIPPAYINFFIKPEAIKEQIKIIIEEGDNFGKTDENKKRTIIIDYSSPNVAKPMHVGHLRSTFIGQVIYNLYKFLGYKVVGDNHLGDWGTQFGMIIAGYKKYTNNASELKNVTVSEMLDIYVRFNKEIENAPDMQETAKAEFKKLEQGDKENRKIWKILRETSLKEFNRIYDILGIKFDLIKGESDYEKELKYEIENALKTKKAIRNEDGSIIISLGEMTPFLIQKSDGATVYGTRDLATIRFRVEKYHPEKIIYVIGNGQSFYLEQLFKSAEILGYIDADKLYHVKFGLVLDENHKKMATREGKVVNAEELINKIIDLADEIIKNKNPKLSEKERKEAAKIIGIGALKYNDLSQNRHTDIVFDWNKMLSFDGNSAPYLLYTYVRLKSIMKKSKAGNFEPSFLKEEIELEIIKQLSIFPKIIERALEDYQLNILANYLFKLAGTVNNFYEKHPVLKAEKDIKFARLALIKSASIVLRNGLNLLGIETLEKM